MPTQTRLSSAAKQPVPACHGPNATTRLGTAVLLLTYFAIWTVTGRYWGLQHDAQVYALQALSKIQPEIFSGDLFLRFRSQDDFTLFPYLCAWVIERIGIDYAAALITLVLFTAWMLLAWYLARALIGAQLAWLAVGLLLVIPGWYGAGLIFRPAEPFLSARTAAEVACLGAFLAFAHGHRLVTVALLGLAAALHPVMALPAALVLTCLSIPFREMRFFWPAAAAVCCVGAIIGAVLIGGQSALMQDEWLRMTQARSGHLFPQHWLTRDWQVNALPLLTVLLSSQLLEGPSQRLAKAVFWIAASGLLLATVAGTILPLKLLLQGQPWRWIWLASVFSIMLLPATVDAAWRHSSAGRIVVLLLCNAWMLAQWSSTDQVPPIGVAGLLLVSSLVIWWTRDRLSTSTLRLMTIGAAVALVLCLLGLAMSVLAVLTGSFDFGTDPLWVQTTANVLHLVAAAACVVTAAWWMTVRSWTVAGGTVVGAAAAALAIAAAPGAAATWRDQMFSPSARAAFADWRDRIPKDAEVLWPDGLQETWFLLDRRSYLTISQLAGVVFSDKLAEEGMRRAALLTPLVPPGYWFQDRSANGTSPAQLTPDLLARICTTGGPDFVVNTQNLGVYVAKAEWPTRAMFRYLYDCREIRRTTLSAQP